MTTQANGTSGAVALSLGRFKVRGGGFHLKCLGLGSGSLYLSHPAMAIRAPARWQTSAPSRTGQERNHRRFLLDLRADSRLKQVPITQHITPFASMVLFTEDTAGYDGEIRARTFVGCVIVAVCGNHQTIGVYGLLIDSCWYIGTLPQEPPYCIGSFGQGTHPSQVDDRIDRCSARKETVSPPPYTYR